MRRAIFAGACLYVSTLSILNGQILEVTPSLVLTDQAALIRATGLQPNEQVTIEASLVDGANETWSAHADFAADARGVVDLSTQAPVRGSYKPVSAMGLIWSMLPRSKSAEIYRPPTNLAVQLINFRLLRNGLAAATAELQQMVMGPGVTETKLKGMLMGRSLSPRAPVLIPVSWCLAAPKVASLHGKRRGWHRTAMWRSHSLTFAMKICRRGWKPFRSSISAGLSAG